MKQRLRGRSRQGEAERLNRKKNAQRETHDREMGRQKEEQRDTGRERNREAGNETDVDRNRGTEILRESRDSKGLKRQRAHKATPAETKTRRTCREPEWGCPVSLWSGSPGDGEPPPGSGPLKLPQACSAPAPSGVPGLRPPAPHQHHVRSCPHPRC